MKIREHFISLIRKGTKTHEYRVVNPKYDNIHIGDVLILISNQDSENYVKVIIDSIEKFSNLNDALNNRWENDFKGLFGSFDEVLKEFHRFYTKEEINQYGINVYTIKEIRVPLKNARYLFDTNTIIEHESSNNVSSEVAQVFASIDKLNGKKFIHDKTIEEINKYKDIKTRDNILTKLNAYQKLIPSNETTDEFERVCLLFSQDENSKNDNEMLKHLYSGKVDFLITSDQVIIEKAKRLYLDDKVFTPNSYLRKVEIEIPQLIEYDVL